MSWFQINNHILKGKNEISDSKRFYKWTAHVQFGVSKYPIILLHYNNN